MDKLSGLVSTEFEREISSGAIRESDSAERDFGAVFANVASTKEPNRREDRQNRAVREGNDLPDSRQTVSANTERSESADKGPSQSANTEKPESADKGPSNDKLSKFEQSSNKEDKSMRKQGGDGDQRDSLEMVSLGASINIITSNMDSVDEKSLADYAKREGIDLSLIQRLLTKRNVGGDALNIGNSEQQIGVDLSKIDEKSMVALLQRRKQQNGDLKNSRYGLSVASLKGVDHTSSKHQAIADISDIKHPNAIKIDQQANPVAAMLSVKIKSDNRDTLVRVKEGETAGKVISMEPIKLDIRSQTGIAANKLVVASLSEHKTTPLQSDLNGKGDEGFGSTTQTGNGKAEINLSSVNELLRSDNDFRKTEQFQLLSQKMADAVGQRLTAQIAKGVWQVQIALKPEQLGRVDIQLGVNGVEIEAVFKSGNILTRELIVEGFPRLKDVLEQSGMEVANLLLDGRQSNGNDGKPSQESKSKGEADGLVGTIGEKEDKNLQVSTVSDDNVDVLV